MTHHLPVRVYVEDTDLGGIVYYANYLKYIERGRSAWLRDAGVDQVALLAQENTGFVVRRIEADYLAPARLDDLLDVRSAVEGAPGNSRVTLRQRVLRDGTVLFDAVVVLVAVRLRGDGAGRPVRLPEAARAVFRA